MFEIGRTEESSCSVRSMNSHNEAFAFRAAAALTGTQATTASVVNHRAINQVLIAIHKRLKLFLLLIHFNRGHRNRHKLLLLPQDSLHFVHMTSDIELAFVGFQYLDDFLVKRRMRLIRGQRRNWKRRFKIVENKTVFNFVKFFVFHFD